MPTEIGGVLLGPLVAALIEALKAAGMPVKYAPWANIVLSTAFWLLAQVYGSMPEYDTWIVAGLQIVIVILTAAGFYQEVVKRATQGRFNK